MEEKKKTGLELSNIEIDILERIVSGEKAKDVFKNISAEEKEAFFNKVDKNHNLESAFAFYEDVDNYDRENVAGRLRSVAFGEKHEKRFREEAKEILNNHKLSKREQHDNSADIPGFEKEIIYVKIVLGFGDIAYNVISENGGINSYDRIEFERLRKEREPEGYEIQFVDSYREAEEHRRISKQDVPEVSNGIEKDELIDHYLLGKMKPEEQTEFEKRIANDSNLQHELTMRRHVLAAIQNKEERMVFETLKTMSEEELKDQLDSIRRKEADKGKKLPISDINIRENKGDYFVSASVGGEKQLSEKISPKDQELYLKGELSDVDLAEKYYSDRQDSLNQGNVIKR